MLYESLFLYYSQSSLWFSTMIWYNRVYFYFCYRNVDYQSKCIWWHFPNWKQKSAPKFHPIMHIYLSQFFFVCRSIAKFLSIARQKKRKKTQDNFQPNQKRSQKFQKIFWMMQNNVQPRHRSLLLSFYSVRHHMIYTMRYCTLCAPHFVSVAVDQRDASMSRFYLTHLDVQNVHENTFQTTTTSKYHFLHVLLRLSSFLLYEHNRTKRM